MGVYCGGLGWGGMAGVGPLLSLVFFAGVIGVLGLGAVWVVQQVWRGETATSRASRPTGEPLEIARRRLAAGEITTQEFAEIRDRLRG
jgi:uncharacterized membrane protein